MSETEMAIFCLIFLKQRDVVFCFCPLRTSCGGCCPLERSAGACLGPDPKLHVTKDRPLERSAGACPPRTFVSPRHAFCCQPASPLFGLWRARTTAVGPMRSDIRPPSETRYVPKRRYETPSFKRGCFINGSTSRGKPARMRVWHPRAPALR